MTMNPNNPDPNLPPRRDDLPGDIQGGNIRGTRPTNAATGAWGWWILAIIIIIGLIWWIGWGTSGGWNRTRTAGPANGTPPATNPAAQPNNQGQASNHP